MKLLIEITEEFYNVLIDESYDSIHNIPLEHMVLVQKVKNGQPLDSVLDEIRAEIDEIKHRKKCWCSDCLDIIDKYKTPHWIERRLSMGIHDWTCSVCKCQNEEPVDICPNCGANTEGRYVLDEEVDDK